jgi:hypothetical protein
MSSTLSFEQSSTRSSLLKERADLLKMIRERMIRESEPGAQGPLEVHLGAAPQIFRTFVVNRIHPLHRYMCYFSNGYAIFQPLSGAREPFIPARSIGPTHSPSPRPNPKICREFRRDAHGAPDPAICPARVRCWSVNKSVLALLAYNILKPLVPQEGFEPPAPSLRMRCSTG